MPNPKFEHLILRDNLYYIPDKAPSVQFNMMTMRLDRRNLLGYSVFVIKTFSRKSLEDFFLMEGKREYNLSMQTE